MSATYDYVVPVTVQGEHEGETSFDMYVKAQPSDVAAKQEAEGQLAMLCQCTSPNLLVGQFTVGQPVATVDL